MGKLRIITHKHKQSTITFSLYSDCNTLPMPVFLQCLIHKNYKALVKEGNPPHELVMQTWDHVYDQYLDLCSGDENAHLYVLQLKIECKELYVLFLQTIEEVLKQGYHIPGFSKKIAARINQLMKLMRISERFTMHAEHIATELQQLRIIGNEQALELNELRAELKSYQQQGGEETTLTEDHFFNWCINMSTFFKYNIQLNNLTVGEFEAYRRSFRKAVQAQEQANKKRA